MLVTQEMWFQFGDYPVFVAIFATALRLVAQRLRAQW